MPVRRPDTRWIACCTALVAVLGGCSQVSSFSNAGAAFESGLATWDVYQLGQSYAVSLREIDHDCYVTLFDNDRIASTIYADVDDTTRSDAAHLLRVVFLSQRKELGGAQPGLIYFATDDQSGRVVIPRVYRAFDSPVVRCPDRRSPPILDRKGEVEGTLTVEFPDRGKKIEARARLSATGSYLISVPVMRDFAGGDPAAEPPPRLVPRGSSSGR